MSKTAEPALMKDRLGKKAIQRISDTLELTLPSFNKATFDKEANKGLNQLELKERVHHLISVLHNHLPKDFNKASKALITFSQKWDRKDDRYSVFAAWPIIDYVAVYGLDHPEESLNTLEHLTSLFSAEFAIRPFIEQHPKKTFSYLKRWIKNDNEHVRRLVSEGTRPRLPWGMQLKGFIQDPTPILPLLESLKDDDSLYVRRSVANNFNDIGKDHPELVLDTAQRWLDEFTPKKGKKIPSNTDELEKNRRWIITHAIRSLIKKGHPKTFAILGYEKNPNIDVKHFKLSRKNINIGGDIHIDTALHAHKKDQKVVIDYSIHFMKANGDLSAKVFKLKNATLLANTATDINKKHSFKLISTRKYYPGKHIVALHINGQEVARETFTLKT